MKKQIKFDDKKLKIIRDTIMNTRKLTSTNLQVLHSYTPEVADAYLKEVMKDKVFVASIKKAANEYPRLLKKYTAEIAKYLKSGEAPEYFTIVNIITRFPVKYTMAAKILWDLRNRKILEDESYYMVKKKK